MSQQARLFNSQLIGADTDADPLRPALSLVEPSWSSQGITGTIMLVQVICDDATATAILADPRKVAAS